MTRKPHTLEQVLAKLYALENREALTKKAYFAINTDKALGLSMPQIRGIAKTITKDHNLAEALWQEDVHETRLLASMVDMPKWVSEDQMDRWVAGFNSWDVCDQTCGELFDRTPFLDLKVVEWAKREEEFVKRAAFVLIACNAVHDKKREDQDYLAYFPVIEGAVCDPRNFVKKAVNWALRQIGKRSAELHDRALALAQKLSSSENKTARWIGSDAARELSSDKILKRLGLA